MVPFPRYCTITYSISLAVPLPCSAGSVAMFWILVDPVIDLCRPRTRPRPPGHEDTFCPCLSNGRSYPPAHRRAAAGEDSPFVPHDPLKFHVILQKCAIRRVFSQSNPSRPICQAVLLSENDCRRLEKSASRIPVRLRSAARRTRHRTAHPGTAGHAVHIPAADQTAKARSLIQRVDQQQDKEYGDDPFSSFIYVPFFSSQISKDRRAVFPGRARRRCLPETALPVKSANAASSWRTEKS